MPFDWGLIIAIYGAALSSALAWFQWLRRIRIRAALSKTSETMEIELFNSARQRFSVRTIQVRYGVEPSMSQTVLEVEDISPLVLDPGDGSVHQIKLQDLRDARARRGVYRVWHGRIWIVVRSFGGLERSRPCHVDEAFIEEPYPRGAATYMAAELALGFPHRNPRARRIFPG